MALLDFRLKHLQENYPDEAIAHVLIQYRGEFPDIEGFKVTSIAGDVAAGTVQVGRLEQLAQHDAVVRIGGTRRLKDEMDVSSVVIDLVDTTTGRRTIPTLGSGAVIGVIDSGFDLKHPCFLNSEKKTRIIAAWDQSGELEGRAPEPFGYGIEYTREMIDGFPDDGEVLISSPNSGAKHGTNVAGIAAGNGAPGTPFAGIAPEAELVLVAYNRGPAIGGSAFVLDALDFIYSHALKQRKPLVVNISQGDNLGAHDGTSLLERAIDYFAEKKNVVIVNSAGNQSGQKHHTEGQVVANEDCEVLFDLDLTIGPVDEDEIDIWYDGKDSFGIALETPSGSQSHFVNPNESDTIVFPSGTKARVFSAKEHPSNHDNRIAIVLEKGDGWEAGPWKLILRGNDVERGGFHAWIERPGDLPVITFTHPTDSGTTTLPGTARRIITVGAFVSRPLPQFDVEVAGALAPFTSFGPTRDGRTKPDLTAPGFAIQAPGVHTNDSGNYDLSMGTSMAAPHVTGVVALLMSHDPNLTAEKIKRILQTQATIDLFTGVPPGPEWGRGKLNAKAAFDALNSSIDKEAKVSANTQTLKLELSVPDGNRGTLPLNVRIEIEQGDIVSITAKSDDTQFVGRLMFTRVAHDQGTELAVSAPTNNAGSGGGEDSGEGAGSGGVKEFGGDECIICGPPPLKCRVVSGSECGGG
jgi:subtilisin family serine protease